MAQAARIFSVDPHAGLAGVLETVGTIESAGTVKPIALCIRGVEQRAGPLGAPLVWPSRAEVWDAVEVLRRFLLDATWPPR